MSTAEAIEKATKADKNETTEHVVITPPNFQEITVGIKFTAPYVQNRMTNKAEEALKAKMESGKRASSKKNREPKDFDRDYLEATHISREGWYGIPAPAFRDAMIDACRLVGYKMTHAKMSVFCIHDGIDKNDGTPLVKITRGKPEQFIAPVRNKTGVIDLRARPIWHECEADVHLQWDADQFSAQDIINLLSRAGLQVGVGAGRPYSKDSFGQGWGRFGIAEGGTK